MEELDILERIRQMCADRRLSFYELARRSGVPYSTLNTLLLKKTQPTLPTLHRLCSGFGITLQQFFSGGDADEPSLTESQKNCLSLFSVLTSEEQALAIAYMKGLLHKL